MGRLPSNINEKEQAMEKIDLEKVYTIKLNMGGKKEKIKGNLREIIKHFTTQDDYYGVPITYDKIKLSDDETTIDVKIAEEDIQRKYDSGEIVKFLIYLAKEYILLFSSFVIE